MQGLSEKNFKYFDVKNKICLLQDEGSKEDCFSNFDTLKCYSNLYNQYINFTSLTKVL